MSLKSSATSGPKRVHDDEEIDGEEANSYDHNRESKYRSLLNKIHSGLLEKIGCEKNEIAAIKKILEAKLAKLVPLKPSTTSGFKRAHDDERDDEGSDHDQKHSRLDGTEDTLLMGADI